MSDTAKNSTEALTKMENRVADMFINRLGVKSSDDLQKLAFASRATGAARMTEVSSDILSLSSAEVGTRIMNLVNSEKSKTNLQFQTSGDFTIDNFTKLIGALITEDADYGTTVERRCYMDDVIKDGGMMADSLIKPVYAAGGGLMDSVSPQAGVPLIKKLDYRLQEVTGQRYANGMEFGDLEMLFTRYQGGSDVAMRGFSQVLTRNMVKLMTIRNNRKQLLKANVITGGETVSRYGSDEPSVMTYNIPGFNQTTPISGTNWGTINPDGSVVPNASADIIGDLNYLLYTYNAWLTAQGLIHNGDLVMNPRTMLLIMQNPTIRAQLQTYNVNPGSPLSPYDNYTVNTALRSLLVGGFNGRIIVDHSAYLLEDSSVAWATDGSQTWGSAPPQQFFFPDGYVFFRAQQNEGPLGEMIYQPALQNGGSMDPGMGDWVAYQDMSGAAWPEGMTRPRSLLTAGFQAGIFLERPIALRTLYVL